MQDGQDEPKVREDLHVYRTEAQYGEKVRKDLNRYRPATKKNAPGARSARACPSHAFRLKQDGQDYQDGQDEGEKGLEDLNVYRCHRSNTEKRSSGP